MGGADSFNPSYARSYYNLITLNATIITALHFNASNKHKFSYSYKEAIVL